MTAGHKDSGGPVRSGSPAWGGGGQGMGPTSRGQEEGQGKSPGVTKKVF